MHRFGPIGWTVVVAITLAAPGANSRGLIAVGALAGYAVIFRHSIVAALRPRTQSDQG